MKSSSRPCPVCLQDQKKNLYRQKFSGLSSGSFLHEYDVCVCVHCGLGLADDLPPAESFDRYYADMSKWEHLDQQGAEPPEFVLRFDSVAQRFADLGLPRDTPLLDIGCSTGGMLAAFKRKGFTRLLGLDPSPRCAELAKKNYGLEVVTGTVRDLPRLPGPFGLVLLSGVLEHFYDPQTALRDISGLLADGGLFYVNVPDATRFAAYMDAPYQQFSIEHILYFTPHSLGNLLAGHGFQPVQTHITTYPYTLRYQYPVVEAVFQKTEPLAWTRDETTEPALLQYLQASREMEQTIDRQLQDLADSRQPILVWGVGTNTQRLMTSSPLPSVNITAFVDSNPNYHGKTLLGRPVVPPEHLDQYPGSILIASIIFREEISRQIRDQLKSDRPLILLATSPEPV
jgi:SAM-dependent methyltransferase